MPAELVVHGPSSALDRALGAQDGPGPVADFLDAVAPGEVRSALRHSLPPGRTDVVLHLVRAKLKPGRKLTAEYDVVLPSVDPPRRVAVTWVVPGATAPGPAPRAEAEARRRGVLAPFRWSWIGSDDRRMSVSTAPVDRAFPQLVRLHDRAHVVDLLGNRAFAGVGGVAPEDVTVETVRYRPGQRHVLRVAVGADGPAWFAKVYRDGTGRRAVEAAARAATAFGGAGDGPVTASVGSARYVTADRVAFWPEVPGLSLAEVIALSGPAVADVVRRAGSALRMLHDASSADDLPACPDAVAHVAETLRTAQLVDALAPDLGMLLRSEVGRALELLTALPDEPPTMVHGDFKCDNLLVSGPGVHVLDLDRSGRGDPAADLGKFLADLRWQTEGDAVAAARLHDAFLAGYGVAAPARVARARAYDGLFQLRMAARRVPIRHPDWAARVARAIGVATATLAGEAER